jgi:hypothetical protein
MTSEDTEALKELSERYIGPRTRALWDTFSGMQKGWMRFNSKPVFEIA